MQLSNHGVVEFTVEMLLINIQPLLCCKPNLGRIFFILFLFNFTIMKPKGKQALLRSNLSAISFMDALHFGKGSNPSLFYKCRYPVWLRKPSH
jgi:hypothetical protein